MEPALGIRKKNTSLLELKNYTASLGLEAKLIGKLEYLDSLSSFKDRVGYAMISDAGKKGLINKDTVIIEPSSGNTGVALAYVAAAKGYRLIITLPEKFSIERRKLMKAFGAELVLTPSAEGIPGTIKKAEELAAATPNSVLPQQFKNPSNLEIHRRTTAEEIWKDTEGAVDILVAGVGTGGTITGVGEVLKERNSDIKIIAVEPFGSPVLSGGKRGPHKLQGIGAGFIPEILNLSIIDEIIQVKNEEAEDTTRQLAKIEGILLGISSGAAAFAATQVARRPENKVKNIIVIFPDTGERYLSTTLFDDSAE